MGKKMEENSIGIFELKTHLSEIVMRVQNGEEFTITNRGNTVAILTPPGKKKSEKQANFFKELRDLVRAKPIATDIDDLKSLIEEGRKW